MKLYSLIGESVLLHRRGNSTFMWLTCVLYPFLYDQSVTLHIIVCFYLSTSLLLFLLSLSPIIHRLVGQHRQCTTPHLCFCLLGHPWRADKSGLVWVTDIVVGQTDQWTKCVDRWMISSADISSFHCLFHVVHHLYTSLSSINMTLSSSCQIIIMGKLVVSLSADNGSVCFVFVGVFLSLTRRHFVARSAEFLNHRAAAFSRISAAFCGMRTSGSGRSWNRNSWNGVEDKRCDTRRWTLCVICLNAGCTKGDWNDVD